MLKKIISVVVVFAIVIGTLSVMSFAEEDSFVPIIRFAVASDVHIDDSNSEKEEARLAKLFETAYAYSESQSYKNLDGVFFAGDFSNTGTSSSMDTFFNIVNQNKRTGTTVRAVLGNHEFYYLSKYAVKRFLSSSGYTESDIDMVIGGYHFIMMCPGNNGRGYKSAQRTWLEKRLAEDTAEDPSGRKPVFVFQHHNVLGTVYGSEAWGVSDLSSILSAYPQVVDFSGHSHFPINDPRSIWQGTFTALNDGTLSYYEMGIAGVYNSGIFPCDYTGGYKESRSIRDAAQYYIVEVSAENAIRVKGYDLLSDTFICEYNIPSVGDPSEFVYTDSRKSESTSPEFTETDSFALKGARNDSAVFEIRQADGDDLIQHYRVEVYDESDNIVKTSYVLSDTFYFPTPERLYCTVDGLQPNTEYYAKCYAVNCWEKESVPLILSFRTTKYYDDVHCYEAPVIPDIFSFVQCESSYAYDGISGVPLSREGEPIVYKDYYTGRYSAEFNGSNAYHFDGFKEFYEIMQNGVTFEYYGVIEEEDFNNGEYVDVFSNQQKGGCGLEVNKNGEIQFYAYVNGRYVCPGAAVPFNEPVHCVGTFDGETVKVYINGVLAASENAEGVLSFTQDEGAKFLCIGGDSADDGMSESNFTGKIVTANVYGNALSADEINQLYSKYSMFDFLPESGYEFDAENKFLYGLDLNKLSVQEIKNAFANQNLFVETDGLTGTGTKITLKDYDGNIYDTAEVLIFGDVNGDGQYDGMDSVIVNGIANGMSDNNDVGNAAYTAADCNHDGVIDGSDVLLLENAGLILSCIYQTESKD